ncbi:MAG: L-threonylcarbamoyladenylate synthase [Solirubrobacteraceae bacterium]
MTTRDAETFARCMTVGGVAVFPADTVYGLACEPDSETAVRRLYALKGRTPGKPAAVMFFARDLALEALPELGPRTRGALERLLPGPVTVLVPNPRRRFGPACGSDPESLGLRVPALEGPLAPLQAVAWPVLQSSANLAGEPEARVIDAVPETIRDGADLVLDGGELPGTASSVVDLRAYENAGEWVLARAGALDPDAIARCLDA